MCRVCVLLGLLWLRRISGVRLHNAHRQAPPVSEREGLHSQKESKKEAIQMGWQSEAMKQAGMSGAELGRRMQVVFPKASKATISMGLRPAETGLVFSSSANKLIAALTGYVFPKKENRRCPVRIQARLTKSQARELNAARAIMGHTTINDALVYALSMYIAESKRRAAVDSATVRDGTGKYPVTSIPSKEAVVNV